MGLRFPAQIHGTCFFVTTTFHGRQRLGCYPGVYQALADSLVFYARRYDVRILGYVFMPSHLHLLVAIDGSLLAAFMRDFKKFTAQKVLPELGVAAVRVWQSRYDRVVITSEKVLRTKLEYIHQNPVRAGLAGDPCHWRWTSTHAYYGRISETPVPVTLWQL